MRVRWQRADDGFVESHDGRWSITPVYGGLTRPESFVLHYNSAVVGSGQTQRECKALAQYIAEDM